MESLLVATDQTAGANAAGLVQGFEDVVAADLVPVVPVEALDVCVLVRLSGLDEAHLDGIVPCPGLEIAADELGQCAHNLPCRQPGIDPDSQRLTVEVIEYPERSEATPVSRSVGHKADGPDGFWRGRHNQQFLDARSFPAPTAAPRVQFVLPVHPVQPARQVRPLVRPQDIPATTSCSAL
jgi:hypothetical protein